MIDEIHIIASGQNSNVNSSNSLNLANLFKPGLARGLYHCIGATTFSEYTKFLSKDKAFERRFQPVIINEPSQECTIEILRLLKESYETYHKCVITDEAIMSCVQLSYRFMSYRNFPDKAIDLLDEACSKMNIDLNNNKRTDTNITVYDVENVMKQILDVPLRLDNEDNKINMLEINLKKHILGQDHVLNTIIKTMKRHLCGFQNENRPIASMMFLGPTGTGKTETVNLLADHYFGSRDKNIIRFDMSEYMESHSVSSLIGSPPGYVGYSEGGKLTNAIKNNPYSIVLFDEIEKANYKVYDVILQILEDGILSDNMGNTFSFKNCIIILTSNIGFTHKKTRSLGFETRENNVIVECIYNLKAIHEELKYTFRPEFLNRIDTILPFNYLSEDVIRDISNQMISEFVEDIFRSKQIQVVVSDETRLEIFKCGLNTNYGARPLRNAINRLIIDPVCEKILLRDGQSIHEWIIV